MSILTDIISKKSKNLIVAQQQPEFPLKYDITYGPYKPITSIVESYKRDFINLLLTSPGEWPMHPDIGVGLKHYLFEFPRSEKLQSLGPKIQEQLAKNLPQVELVDLSFDYKTEDIDNNKTSVILAYLILGSINFTSLLTPDATDIIQVKDLEMTKLQNIDILNRNQSLISDLTVV